MNNADLITKLRSKNIHFSKGQRRIADYILQHYDKAAFMTARRMGEVAHVSESTVVRFAVELGYHGYPEMQHALQDFVRTRLTSVQKIDLIQDRIGDQDVLQAVLQSDIEQIRQTLEQIDRDQFNAAVSAILSARRIYILGVRSSAALASFIGFYFNLMFENIRLVHTTSVSEMFEQIVHVGEEDIVIGISFPRYSSRTVKAVQFAHDQGAKVLVISDGPQSPLAPLATFSLYAKSDMGSFVDSLVAPLSLLNALILAIGMRRNHEISETFDELERIWDEYGVYEKADSDEF